MIHPIEIAWLSGFIDGEGSFGLYPVKGRKILSGMFSMNNTHFATMQVVMELLKDASIEFDCFLRKRHHEGRKDQVVVRMRNRKSLVKLMHMIEPFLVTKKLQVLLLLKYFENHVDGKSATVEECKIADEIKGLNAYGRGISS